MVIGLAVAVLITDAWRRGEELRRLARFTVTWAAAGFVAVIVADGLHFDLSVAARTSGAPEPVVITRVALQLVSAACAVALLLSGRTVALLALVASTLLLVGHAHAAPFRMFSGNGGCVVFSHALQPARYQLECAIAALVAIAPWVGPALRTLAPRHTSSGGASSRA